LLCLNSLDDPLSPMDFLPSYSVTTQNSAVILVRTKLGGHVAWIDYLGRSWMDKVALEFLDNLPLVSSKKLE